ncbi:MAG: hypothetical protein CL780_06300 [Chloroflexi bacterium]|nr:hypothetical protein [Chloroflexota bacterium]|tara:strand:+ start:1936 stop:2298 length:363 start_codon:yes stop_codon:yes gene_type:complete
MSNRLDDELDQILRNAGYEDSEVQDEPKNNPTNYIPKITSRYLIPITCLLLSFFIIQVVIPTSFVNKVIFWGLLIVFVVLFSAYLLESKTSEFQPKWRGKPVENVKNKGLMNRFIDFFRS